MTATSTCPPMHRFCFKEPAAHEPALPWCTHFTRTLWSDDALLMLSQRVSRHIGIKEVMVQQYSAMAEQILRCATQLQRAATD